ncbi:MAG: alcohol dehydrogenase catalytic domain-containing protein, partial [Planctomycetes bacterium]|nr:alcohol dehydrogenase catalytic domain-containing protein [Planctomycetota bacterium]
MLMLDEKSASILSVVVGRIVKTGDDVKARQVGERVGVGWFYSSCGSCRYCLAGNEN